MTRLANTLEVLAFLSMAAVVLGSFGRWHFLPDLLCHFRLQATGTLIIAGSVLWFLKRTRWSLASLLFGVVLLVSMAPYWLPLPDRGPAGYRLMSMNVLTGNPHRERVTDYIVTLDPDFVLLQEIDRKWVSLLDEELQNNWPYRKTVPREDNFGIGIYSKLPWTQCEVLQLSNQFPTPSIASTFSLPDGNALRLIVTHPVPPINHAYWMSRNELFVNLATEVQSHDAARTIVAGDLNCSPWSWHFTHLLDASALSDAAIGHGMSISWLPIPITALGLPIDHVLVGDAIRVADLQVGPYLASDHRPVTMDFD